jgi:hypothetical protein
MSIDEMMMLVGENSLLVHQSSLAVLPEELSGSEQEEWLKEVQAFYSLLRVIFYMP